MPNNDPKSNGYTPPPSKQKDLNSGVLPPYMLNNQETDYSFPQVTDSYDFLSTFNQDEGEEITAPLLPKGELGYTVKQGESLYSIAAKHNITIPDLLFENNMQLLDEASGKIRYKGQETFIQPGMNLQLPAKTEQKKEEAKVVDGKEMNDALAGAAEKSGDPLRTVLKALLSFPMSFLGTGKGSKVTAEFKVMIPTPAAIVKITLGGLFEQERKEDNKTLVTHKMQPKLGVLIDGSMLEGEVTLFGLFEVTSANLDDAVSLIYYGLYKLGRATGDAMNDWGAVLASSGGTMGLSLAMFCGLNLLYAEDKKVAGAINAAENKEIDEASFLDKLKSANSAEMNIAAMEQQLFGYDKSKGSKPFDENNQNKVAFGGGVEGKLSGGNEETGTAEGTLTFTGKTEIDAKSLNATGVYGKQDAGFTDDYKIGGLKEMQLEMDRSLDIKGNKFGIKHSFTWGEVQNGNRSGKSTGMMSDEDEVNWAFKKYEFILSGELAALSKFKDNTTRTLIEQLVGDAVAVYQDKKNEAKQKDKNASLPSLDGETLASKAVLELGLAEVKDMAKIKGLDAGPVKMTDKAAIALKITAEGGLKGIKPSVEISIGRIEKIEVDAKVAEFSFTDLDIIGTLKLL